MALEYVLVDNKLTPDPDDCAARTQNVRNVQMDEIVTRMTGRHEFAERDTRAIRQMGPRHAQERKAFKLCGFTQG